MSQFSEADLKLIEDSGCTPDEVGKILAMFPQSLETAIGHVVGLKKGMGQERNEPFTTEAPPTM